MHGLAHDWLVRRPSASRQQRGDATKGKSKSHASEDSCEIESVLRTIHDVSLLGAISSLPLPFRGLAFTRPRWQPLKYLRYLINAPTKKSNALFSLSSTGIRYNEYTAAKFHSPKRSLPFIFSSFSFLSQKKIPLLPWSRKCSKGRAVKRFELFEIMRGKLFEGWKKSAIDRILCEEETLVPPLELSPDRAFKRQLEILYDP